MTFHKLKYIIYLRKYHYIILVNIEYKKVIYYNYPIFKPFFVELGIFGW